MAVHICPVCNGRGTVPPGFYDDGTTTDVRQTCRACGGTGVIITPEKKPKSTRIKHKLPVYPRCPPYKPYIPRRFPILDPQEWWGQGPWYA